MPQTICDNMVPFMFQYLKQFGRDSQIGPRNDPWYFKLWYNKADLIQCWANFEVHAYLFELDLSLPLYYFTLASFSSVQQFLAQVNALLSHIMVELRNGIWILVSTIASLSI